MIVTELKTGANHSSAYTLLLPLLYLPTPLATPSATSHIWYQIPSILGTDRSLDSLIPIGCSYSNDFGRSNPDSSL